MTDANKKEIAELKKNILEAEKSLDAAKKALLELTGEDLTEYVSAKPQKRTQASGTPTDGKVIEGVFNGENMVGPEGKIFPVPANYASKSKLVEGDKLKLTVAEDGAFIFKQIGPVERKNLVGDLVFEDNAYHVNAEGKRYNLLYAAVTYHKAKPGDRVTIVVPAREESQWAAFENIIHNVAPATEEKVSDLLDLDLPEKEKPPVTTPVPPPLPPVTPAPDTTLDVSAMASESPQSQTPPPTPPPIAPTQAAIQQPEYSTTDMPHAQGTSLAEATYDDTEDTTNSLGEKIPGADEPGNSIADLEI